MKFNAQLFYPFFLFLQILSFDFQLSDFSLKKKNKIKGPRVIETGLTRLPQIQFKDFQFLTS